MSQICENSNSALDAFVRQRAKNPAGQQKPSDGIFIFLGQLAGGAPPFYALLFSQFQTAAFWRFMYDDLPVNALFELCDMGYDADQTPAAGQPV